MSTGNRGDPLDARKLEVEGGDQPVRSFSGNLDDGRVGQAQPGRRLACERLDRRQEQT
jgi:hypothetical protein